jgi:arylsulfatase A-like enzyme
VVLITWHDLGRHLGCYGWETVATPALDRLAAEGVQLDRMWCNSPGCSPSRAGLITGRYPHSNGVMGLVHRGWRFNPGERTLGHLLQAAGYRTALAGMQHEHHTAAKVGEDGWLQRPAAEYAEVLGYQELLPVRHTWGDEVARAATAYFQRCTATPGQPFFLAVGMSQVHRPNKNSHVPEPPRERLGQVRLPPTIPDLPATRLDMARYEAMIEQADAHVGELLAGLAAAGLAGNTVVVFTTDHGSEFCRAKMTLYEAGLEVACLVRWPGGVPGGRRLRGLYSNLDLAPTLLELAGAPVPATMQGQSFAASLRGPEQPGREAVFAEKQWHVSYDPIRAVRTDRWKLIWHKRAPEPLQPSPEHALLMGLELASRWYGTPRAEFELYDLNHDPDELYNLADCPACADELSSLKALLWAEMARTDDPLLRGDIPPIAQHPPLHAWQAQPQPDGTVRYALTIDRPERFKY